MSGMSSTYKAYKTRMQQLIPGVHIDPDLDLDSSGNEKDDKVKVKVKDKDKDLGEGKSKDDKDIGEDMGKDESALWKKTNDELRKMLPGKKGISKLKKEKLVELIISSKSTDIVSD